ncbi:MAG TPA: hypothetical protein ENK78_03225 [Thiothrix sp.]|nr:hypothetical protein [Thiothrix sp.]
MAIDWVIVKKFKKEIGAVGFINNNVAVIVAFYDDRDGNKDGNVSVGEWLATKFSRIEGKAITEVAMAARYDMDILQRDMSFHSMANKLFIKFAQGLVADAIYTVYFSKSISKIAGAIAGRASNHLVKQYVIKKGMESSVKNIYNSMVQ